MKENWEVVIGLEIHAQLATKSKLFSASSTAYGASANSQANIIDLAMPGVLPVLNQTAIEMALKFGLAIDADIPKQCVFARKNYFYPDLPKGYQISQYDKPIVGKGKITILVDNIDKTIGITRAHLEEDAGKSLHENFANYTGIDLNRAGTPLLEIVSEPDLRSTTEAVAYAKKIHNLVKYLEICDGNMQEGSFRCDANVSIRPRGQKDFGTRTELKNLNSFKFLEKAIDYEINRQIKVLTSDQLVIQETRLYDANKNKTFSMRSKEEANDYRYFPDPDLLPVLIDEQTIAAVKASQTELPDKKKTRFAEQYGLSSYDIEILTADKQVADYFEFIVKDLGNEHAKLVSNWVTVNLAGALNSKNIDISDSPISASSLTGLLKKIIDKSISNNIAKQVFESMLNGEGSADEIIKARKLDQVTDLSDLEKIIEQVLTNNQQQMADYKDGKTKLFGFFVGQVMKETKGQADPVEVNKILKAKLN